MIDRTAIPEGSKSREIETASLQGESASSHAPVDPSRANQPRGGPSSADGFRVLIIDDEKAVLEVVDEMLQAVGYKTVALSSPVEALQKVKRQKFDALILDVYMPEMSGMLFHAKLRLVDPELAGRTVFMSGYVSREELRQHLSATPTFLEKPFKAQDLGEMVSKVLPEKPRR